jgi:hypothetical protein
MFERGELQIGAETSYADLGQLECEGELMELEEALRDPEMIAAGIEDIRGRIYNQPGRLYAKIDPQGGYGETGPVPSVAYYGIVESEVAENFYE